jgi:hypothetical protein
MTFLSKKRITVYARIFISAYLLIWGSWIFTGSGLLDRTGKPIGADFLVFWSASSMARTGDPASVYDFQKFYKVEQNIANYPNPWVYPPTYLLMVLPLSLLPYLPSFIVWILSTFCIYLTVIRRIAPHPTTTWLALAYPGTFQNIVHGQNGFLSTALLGGGLLLLENFPLTAGILFGLLSYKPHFAILVPIALAAGKYWKALAAMFISSICFILLSGIVLGWGTWIAFYNNISSPIMILIQEKSLWIKMPTTFASFLLAGYNLSLAGALHGFVMFGTAIIVAWVWYREAPFYIRGSALISGILLFTPYAYYYDLSLLALPLAWLGWKNFTVGWKLTGNSLLIIIWLLPIIAPAIAIALGIQISPILIAFLLFFTLRQSHKNKSLIPS